MENGSRRSRGSRTRTPPANIDHDVNSVSNASLLNSIDNTNNVGKDADANNFGNEGDANNVCKDSLLNAIYEASADRSPSITDQANG